MIKFENITATYTEKVGIFNLSFHIPQGELVFLMGPTGAGKSTVLKTIYRDIPIADGILYINGEDVGKIRRRHIPRFRRKIGMVFQDYRLIPDRTVFENIALPLQIEGISKKSKNHFYGRTTHNATVVFEKENASIGEYVMVKIVDCTSATLKGKI